MSIQTVPNKAPTVTDGAAHVNTPICYHNWKVHLLGPEACYVDLLGRFVTAPTWPELRAKIDAILGYGLPSISPVGDEK